VTDRGRVRELALDRGGRNALTVGLCEGLTAALREAAGLDPIDAVILGSSSGAFCAGCERPASAAAAADFARAIADLALTLATFAKPIVAIVNGLAAGIGATTLLHCDFVIASEFAGIEFSSAKASLLPDGGVSVLLPARVGQALAAEFLLVGERLNPRTAERLGLINRVVPLEDLTRSGYARAEALSALPRAAVREAKRLLREPQLAAITEAVRRERDAALLAARDGELGPGSAPLR
jgi:enoyl-CoA hydratase/carnithine racemase